MLVPKPRTSYLYGSSKMMCGRRPGDFLENSRPLALYKTLTANFHSPQRRVQGLLVAFGKGRGPRTSAHVYRRNVVTVNHIDTYHSSLVARFPNRWLSRPFALLAIRTIIWSFRRHSHTDIFSHCTKSTQISYVFVIFMDIRLL